MKTDLAPRYLYYCSLTVLGLGLICVGIIHQYTMDYAIKQDDFTPFMFTSVLWVMDFLGVIFIINRCRYIIINPADESKLVMGNLLTNTHGQADKLTIEKKVWRNLFKVNIEGKQYYIFSFDETVDEYKRKSNG
jgi:hypothetical protein